MILRNSHFSLLFEVENEVFPCLREVEEGSRGLGKHNEYSNAHCEEWKSDPGTHGRVVEGNCHLAEDREHIFAVALLQKEKINVYFPLKPYMGVEVVANIEIFVMK